MRFVISVSGYHLENRRFLVSCQCCGVEAPTQYVEFFQNIGAIVVRFHKSIKGNLCKNCIDQYFWEYTMISLVAGWWGFISFFMTPFVLLNNIIRYLGTQKLPSVPAGAVPPTSTQDVVSRLRPYTDEIVTRLNSGEAIDGVVQSVAPRAGVIPDQVYRYIYALYEPSNQQQ
jgi:hypothetical protein